MIYGHIDVKENKGAYPETIHKAIQFLRDTDVVSMSAGNYPIEGDKLILQIQEPVTAPKETRKPEIHRKYIDVQYMIHGHEYIGCYPDQKDGGILEDRLDREDDILFYKENEKANEIMLPMTDGCYAVFFPEDVHRPCCQMGEPEAIKKAVLKVRVDTL